ncbi:Shr3 amino acid permease chaperone [Phellopilus nigrolimitatus]|nr:Shr3 amino acid permease chaperone [Phellopilus nigrolimitatus]
MGLRISVVICSTSFLLGIIFTHWIADSLTLWKSSITNDNIWTSAAYYSLLARAPGELGYAVVAVVTLGAATILWSFGDGAAENLMFDGASIFLYGTAIAVYLYKVLPSFVETFSSVPSISSNKITSTLKSEVLNLASANLVCSVALTGVIALQAARWWAERPDLEEEVEGARSEDTPQRRPGQKLKRRENPKLSASRLASTPKLEDARAKM